ncbi:hypothetical protein HZS_4699 [Henneguya salminicola]|nr:hypothetical protein HZS_4699 [Henneguya salminicola]
MDLHEIKRGEAKFFDRMERDYEITESNKDLYKNLGKFSSSILPSDKSKSVLNKDSFKSKIPKNFKSLIEQAIEEAGEIKNLLYFQIVSPVPIKPTIKLCTCCGNLSKYRCSTCRALYCSIRCKEIHVNTRCQKHVI